jgi:Macrocin-O-methyltransferase (TylF)
LTGSLYLDLMKQVLTGGIYGDKRIVPHGPYPGYTETQRRQGRGWPATAHTMIGLTRLSHLQWCTETILEENIPGDLLEAGVWRGGAVILMAAVLKTHGETGRLVWAADSFAGMPPAGPADQNMPMDHYTELAVPIEEVTANIAAYGLTEQIRLLPGWFKNTLPGAPIGSLAVLRLDADMYSSTTEALTCLYPKLSPGGFAVIDDWSLQPCRQAVTRYRDTHAITAPIEEIDWTGVFWRKQA